MRYSGSSLISCSCQKSSAQSGGPAWQCAAERAAPQPAAALTARDAECLDVCCESQACRLGAPGVQGDRIQYSASASSRIRICVTRAKIWSWAAECRGDL